MKEQIEAKIAVLRKEKEAMIANLNGIEGAIQISEQYLKELEEKPATLEKVD